MCWSHNCRWNQKFQQQNLLYKSKIFLQLSFNQNTRCAVDLGFKRRFYIEYVFNLKLCMNSLLAELTEEAIEVLDTDRCGLMESPLFTTRPFKVVNCRIRCIPWPNTNNMCKSRWLGAASKQLRLLHGQVHRHYRILVPSDMLNWSSRNGAHHKVT